TFPLIRPAVEYTSRPQSPGRLQNGVQHPQLEDHAIPAQLERVIHVLDYEPRVIKDLHDDPVCASSQFDRPWCGVERWLMDEAGHSGTPSLESLTACKLAACCFRAAGWSARSPSQTPGRPSCPTSSRPRTGSSSNSRTSPPENRSTAGTGRPGSRG